MTPKSNLYRSRHGAALVLVLAMIVIMTGLVITVFVSVTGERRSAAVKVQGMSASQLASSAPQLVMSQIQNAVGTGSTPWTSQPGMIRTFDPTSGNADRVYKLYSASRMSEQNFTETADAPPTDWNSGKNLALFCDINRPVTSSTSALASASAALIYPIADPSVANVDFDRNENTKVPGYQIKSNDIPGYDSGSTASPTNNPLPMPVRWLYILKDGRMAVPNGVSEDKVVSFTPDDQAQSIAAPSASNPVVGRIAFWADDDTCKVNINTAGYAKNDNSYWTYWDTPVGQTQDEIKYLSWGQPWGNEFQRYPGHPATTGLNVVFDSLNLTDNQILTLITPRYTEGGTKGGSLTTFTTPTSDQIASLRKNERLFPSVDEMFYDKNRAKNTNSISQEDLEARRFLLTATSRAPELTIWNTPRTTIWPTFQDPTKRTAIDKLITFCSTIGGQPFYFVRDSPLATDELNKPQNLNLWNYLHFLSEKKVPGYTQNFGNKYPGRRDQILTSIFDAIRLANLDDRTGPDTSTATAGWSFTAGKLSKIGGKWDTYTSFPAGYVAPSVGPNNTRSPGRTGTLAEVAFLFARKTADDWDTKPGDSETAKGPDGFMPIDKVNAAVFYGFYEPTAGMVQPGQSRRIRVSGLKQFYVADADVTMVDTDGVTKPKPQYLFSNDVYEKKEVDIKDSSRRDLGGKLEWTLSSMDNPPIDNAAGGLPYGPPTSVVTLPYYTYNPTTEKGSENLDKTFIFSGGEMTIQLFSPWDAPTAFQTYKVKFPSTSAPSPMIIFNEISKYPSNPTRRKSVSGYLQCQWNVLSGDGRLPGQNPNPTVPRNYYEQRYTFLGDTVLAVCSETGAYAWEALRQDTIDNFKPHNRYTRTWDNGDINTLPMPTTLKDGVARMTRRASTMKWASNNAIPNIALDGILGSRIFGRLQSDVIAYANAVTPVIPCRDKSIEEEYGVCDFSSGPGMASDGSLLPKTDEGAAVTFTGVADQSPYFRDTNTTRNLAEPTLSTPNRQMPSAIYFGSIPTAKAWQTLLFRPARSYHPGGTGHPGASIVPDYWMLDWFHMPIVEPYAISEPFSTAGKINLNSRIMPFSGYMRRETGLHAILRSARIPAISNALVTGTGYAVTYGGSSTAPSDPTRFSIDEEETLKAIRDRFDSRDGANKRTYLSNAEICSIDLVPKGFTQSSVGNFWSDKKPTGDNLREGAYSTILPRLTARSNTYTVHVTAEALQTTEANGGWREGRGIVTAEWRGSYGIERYIDPNDARFTSSKPEDPPHDFLQGDSVERFYKFRILGEKRFDP